MIPVGTRVVAFLARGGRPCLLGYGVYEGDFVPDAKSFHAGSLRKFGRKSQRILLDSGHTVWGCECLWGDEESSRDMAARFGDKTVDIDQWRSEEALWIEQHPEYS